MSRNLLAPLGFAMLLIGASASFAAETYRIDPAHTSVGFAVKHFGINLVKGHFTQFEGALVMEDGKLSAARGTIQAASLNTGVEARDDHLRSADFLDTATHPKITFQSKRIEGEVVIVADFSMRGVTREIELPAKVSGPIEDPTGRRRIGLEASAVVNRKDYNINYHQVLESGVPAVGDEVRIEIHAEAILE